MAEFDSKKALAIDNRNRTMKDCLDRSFEQAKSIDMVVSFLMDSGIKTMREVLDDLKARKVKVRLLTSTYLNITSPTALYRIKKEYDDVFEIQIFNDSSISFHPKAYFFHYEDDDEVYVGSSNFSRSALESGVEWNVRLHRSEDQKAYSIFFEDFEYLWQERSIPLTEKLLKKYANEWKKIVRVGNEEQGETSTAIEPRGVQIEALYELNKTRQEGAKRGLVHAATGIGKTYLAAFDSVPFKKVLFVAHRKEILEQAKQAFENVRHCSTSFFYADEKSLSGSVVLASVQTLGKPEFLKDIDPSLFDYIVVDEFHHAVNSMYLNIIEHFKPKFLLGLTATPERMDGRSIYALCDYNVPYEIDLRTAINREILVPFHYYGIYDDSDFSNYKYKSVMSTADIDQVVLNNKKRTTLILEHYNKYISKKALGFCSSKEHARQMAEAFNLAGVPSVAVYSGSDEGREEALEKLRSGKIKVLFSVDMFNEGMDIKEVDMLLFLRPTQSSTVFLQQLGRGLRTASNKQFVTVLDFIGNYKNSDLALKLLPTNTGRDIGFPIDPTIFPEGCVMDVDLRLIDLFKTMHRSVSLSERIGQEYTRIKDLVGHIPSRMDLFTYMDEETYLLMVKNTKLNIMRDYEGYIQKREGKKIEDEYSIHRFIKMCEQTSMSKTYKMAVLSAFIDGEHLKEKVSETDLVVAWKDFYGKGTFWKDLDMSYGEYLKMSDRKFLSKIKAMPCKFLMSKNDYFYWENGYFCLNLKKEDREDPKIAQALKDVIVYRTYDYFKRRYDEEKSIE